MDDDMKLPEGVTCDSCQHARRCFGIGYSEPGRTECDFSPSRYRRAWYALATIGPGPCDDLGNPVEVIRA